MKQVYKIACIALLSLTACTKYLDKKPDQSLSTPGSIKELQGLLDFESNNVEFPIAAELTNDNFYYTPEDWDAIFLPEEKLAYVWDPETDMEMDWKFSYAKVFTSNVVLDALEKMDIHSANRDEYNNVKGTALFFRAFNYYELAQVFAPPYTFENIEQKLGIPLRNSPNIDEKTERSTVGQTYDRIINDLKDCVQLLPENTAHYSRPGKAAAYALIARTYLSMRDYISAGKYADSSLSIQAALLDYNDPVNVSPDNEFPFNQNNAEILFLAIGRQIGDNARTKVAPELLALYDDNDIRRAAFFHDNGDGSFMFKGNYYPAGNTALFCGITTAEMYLVSAECKARSGDLTGACSRLNALLEKRWRTGTYLPVNTGEQSELLTIILNERRKELCFRTSLRWTDLRRLNQEPAYSRVISRDIGGAYYELQPGDPRYTFLVPQSVIDMTMIGQNPR